MRDDVLGDRRLVAAALFGLVLFVAGIALESAALGTVSILGAGLITAVLVLPIVSKLTIGAGAVSFERTPTSRDRAIAALAEELGPTLHEVARWLSAGDDLRAHGWVRQALACAYRDGDLVPRDQRDHHVLCLLVRAVRAGTAMEEMSGRRHRGDPARGDQAPEGLVDIPFDDRAALILRRVAQLDDVAGAQVLHISPDEFATCADRAAARLQAWGAERT